MNTHTQKILIVDDQIANIRLLEMILQNAGYEDCWSTTDPTQALWLFESCKPDIMLLDLQMPQMDGFAVMKQIREAYPEENVPVLILTADATVPTKHRALGEGARDFLCKPFDEVEVLLRIRNLLEIRSYAIQLEAKVLERTAELDLARLEVLERLAHAGEYRDTDTGLHTHRVANTTALIAKELGMCPSQVEDLYHAAPLHDIGKIGIDDAILRKPGKLTDEEFAAMKRHVTIGQEILSGSTSQVLRLAEEIALYHHERWDGKGYLRIAGPAIPLSARIVSVADVFDALTHERPYKPAWPVAEAVAEIRAGSGTQFDPRIVVAFMTLSHDDLI
jgi:putative two-component system response regulator